jgi:Uma2 family endonuclease
VAVTTHLMTVAEFARLPEDRGGVYHELRHGEVIAVTRPKLKHISIQQRLRHLLEQQAPPHSMVGTEVPYRPLPEHELRVADVAYLSAEQVRVLDPDDYVQGVPELVIEVLSPSNSATEMFDKEKICLENGGREFWVVDPERRQIKVSTPDGHTVTYRAGQKVPLGLCGGAGLAVDAIF